MDHKQTVSTSVNRNCSRATAEWEEAQREKFQIELRNELFDRNYGQPVKITTNEAQRLFGVKTRSKMMYHPVRPNYGFLLFLNDHNQVIGDQRGTHDDGCVIAHRFRAIDERYLEALKQFLSKVGAECEKSSDVIKRSFVDLMERFTWRLGPLEKSLSRTLTEYVKIPREVTNRSWDAITDLYGEALEDLLGEHFRIAVSHAGDCTDMRDFTGERGDVQVDIEPR